MTTPSRIIANNDIQYRDVRLVTESSSEVLPIYKAIEQAKRAGLDLILINDQSDPPICKLVELDKYQYDIKRKEKEVARAHRDSRVVVKEVQFKPNIDQHDFETKCNKIAKFIASGNKVKVLIQFRGRERQFSELGYDVLNRVLSTVEGIENDGQPSFVGNRIVAMLKGIADGTKK
jgi:translation initiation factor IF-3